MFKRLCMLAVVAAALVLATPLYAKQFSARTLSDARLGNSPAELLAQKDHSQDVLTFFRHRHWMTAARHSSCNSVPWSRTCKVARGQVRLHRWLFQLASTRYQRIAFSPTVVRAWVLKYHPCLDQIIQLENRSYDPTVNYGGGHGNTSLAYGIPQAYPGTKMAWAGADWRINPYTQLKWMISYTIKKFGSECAARDSRVNHNSY